MISTHPLNFPTLDTPGGTVHRLPTEYFLQHVLPPLPDGIDPQRVLAKVRRSGTKYRQPITKQGRWRGFAQTPVQANRCEAASFTHFPDIVKSIAKAGAPRGAFPLLKLVEKSVCWPASDPHSTDSNVLELLQMYMVQNDVVPRKASWSDFAVAGWFSKSDKIESPIEVCVFCYIYMPIFSEIIVQNRENIIAGMMLCMRGVDRRSTFGFTVSNTRMEFWYYDKSQIIVTNPVNWITVSRTLVDTF